MQQKGRLRALDPLLYDQWEDQLHTNSKFVEHFYQLVTESVEPPFAISIDGLWGSGKTTVMKMLQQRLESVFWVDKQSLEKIANKEVSDKLEPLKNRGYKSKEDFVNALESKAGMKKNDISNYQDIIFENCKFQETPYPTFWFNPWEYQDAESVVMAFLKCLAAQAHTDFGDAVNEGVKILSVLGRLGMNLGINALLKPLVNLEMEDIQKAGENYEEAQKKAYEKYKDLIKIIQADFKRLLDNISKQEKYHGKPKPVIIFFDDLDRCLPDKTIQLLEAVKNLFVVKGTKVIFVCGIDTHIAKQFIKAHYKDIEEAFAINYFRKIFNLTISLPYYSTNMYLLLLQYIKNLYDWNDVQEENAGKLANMVAGLGLRAEMASARTYLNVIHNFYTFLRFNRDYRFNPENDVVVYLLVIKETCPPLYDALVKKAMKNPRTKANEIVQEVIIDVQDNKNSDKLASEQIAFLQNYFGDALAPFRDTILCELFLHALTLA